MKILFVGGRKHGDVADTRSGEVPMEKVAVPYDPDDRLGVFTGEGAIVQICKPMNSDYYTFKRVIEGTRVAYVYVADGICDEHLLIYLKEPYIKEKFTDIMERFPGRSFSSISGAF